MKKKRQSKRAGLKPLGPVHGLSFFRYSATRCAIRCEICGEVMAREEAVDPLQKVVAQLVEVVDTTFC